MDLVKNPSQSINLINLGLIQSKSNFLFADFYFKKTNLINYLKKKKIGWEPSPAQNLPYINLFLVFTFIKMFVNVVVIIFQNIFYSEKY